jgi:integrase
MHQNLAPQTVPCTIRAPSGSWYTVATYQKRGDSWRAIVRKKGYPAQTQTFPTKGMAKTWAERVEREIAERAASGASASDSMTLADLLEWYGREAKALTPWGRSKEADLRRLKSSPLADRVVSELRLADFVRHAEQRRAAGAGPATVLNDIIWLRQVLRTARASLGMNAPLQALDDAAENLRSRRVIAKPKQRTRRLTEAEELTLLAYFKGRDGRAELPMVDLMRFALLTARRQEEITRIKWVDLDTAKGIAWLDDVKHPRKKAGNRRAFRVLAEAWQIIERQPRTADEVFPYNPKSVGAAFTRACQFLGIADLRFHDLRHEATSRLFERGYSIQEVAQFTLHESWTTLKRYTHLRPEQVPER